LLIACSLSLGEITVVDGSDHRTLPAMTHDEALAWAKQWIDEWNRRDVEAVLAHFADDVEFCSPLVVSVTGEASGVVRGRDALREYWTAALAERPDLHFELDDVTVGVNAIAIHYRNRGRRATEVAVFDADGHVVRGWGLYGAPEPRPRA
jgi:hypothetical protein